MQLLELILQGVRKFTASQKIAFRPGLNVVYGSNESGKTTLVECIRSLFYPASLADGSHLVGWESARLSRAALSFTGGDGASYRILRDFVTGACTLSKGNPQTGKFDPLDSGAGAVETRLRGLGIPAPEVFDTLLCVRAAQVAAAGGSPGGGASAPSGGSGGAPGGAGTIFQGAAVDVPGESLSPEEKKQRIADLRVELEAAGKLEKIQFELDGLEGKKFETQGRLQTLKELEGKLSQAKEGLAPFKGAAEIDADLEGRLTRFAVTEKNFQQEVHRLEEKRMKLDGDSQIAQATLEPLQKNNILLGGAALSVLAFVLAFTVKKVLILLLVPGLGVAGVGFYLWNERATRAKQSVADLAAAVKQKADLERKFDIESAMVKELLKKFDVQNVKEILDRKKAAKKAQDRLQEIEKELEKQKDTPEMREAREAREAMEGIGKRISELQDQIASLGAVTMDAPQIKREIKRLEDELSGKAPDSARPLGAPAGMGAGLPGGGPGGGGTDALLTAAAAAAGTPKDQYLAAAQPRLFARVGSLTGGRHPGAVFEGAEIRLQMASGGLPQPLAKLSASTREALYLSMLLGICEGMASAIPFLWDDVAGAFDEERLAALALAVKSLAASRHSQALWFTSRKEVAAAADHLVKLAR